MLREVWHVLWSRRRLVLGVVLVLLAASLVYSLLQDRVYTAEATILMRPQGGESSGQDTASFLQEVQSAVSTDEMLAEARRKADAGSVNSADQPLDVSQFVRQDSQESGFIVSYSASEPEEAARVANAYATLFVERVGEVNDRLAGGSLAAEADVEMRAVAPGSPASPRPLIYAGLALILGVGAGGAGALLLDSRGRSWRGARDAEMTLRAPVLGVIPEYSQQTSEAQE